MTEELTGDMTLALVLDEVNGREADVLEAVRSVHEAISQGGLTGGDTATLWMSGNHAAHQPTSIVETNHHLRERWRKRRENFAVNHPTQAAVKLSRNLNRVPRVFLNFSSQLCLLGRVLKVSLYKQSIHMQM